MDIYTIIDVTSDNIMQERLFCAKTISSPGFRSKHEWFCRNIDKGLNISILKDADNRQLAFIEFLPAEHAWRPIEADNYYFIQCLFTYSNTDKHKGLGSRLIEYAEKKARLAGARGLCTMTSSGAWVADSQLFLRNGFYSVDSRGRFELLVKPFETKYPEPRLLDWELKQKEYSGWHLIYADQCPWHEKSAEAIARVCQEAGITLNITKLHSSQEAKNAPSGFGVFSLLKDGRLLEDHYLSETRFRNILKKEIQVNGG